MSITVNESSSYPWKKTIQENMFSPGYKKEKKRWKLKTIQNEIFPKGRLFAKIGDKFLKKYLVWLWPEGTFPRIRCVTWEKNKTIKKIKKVENESYTNILWNKKWFKLR